MMFVSNVIFILCYVLCRMSPRKKAAASKSKSSQNCMATVEKLKSSEVWVVKVPSTVRFKFTFKYPFTLIFFVILQMDIRQLQDRVLGSSDLPFEAQASKKGEAINVLASDAKDALRTVQVQSKGTISFQERVDTLQGSFGFCHVEAPRFQSKRKADETPVQTKKKKKSKK